jgi:hypothetical protein
MAIHIATSQTEDIAATAPLFAGEYPIETIAVTVLSGQTLSPLSVVGKVTASGKYVLADADADDGSEQARLICVDGVNASGGDKVVNCYKSGTFNIDALVFDESYADDAAKLAAFDAESAITVKKAGPAV